MFQIKIHKNQNAFMIVKCQDVKYCQNGDLNV